LNIREVVIKISSIILVQFYNTLGAIYISYGTVIREARKKKGLNQRDLALLVGCTRTTVCDWETEKYAPTAAGNINAIEEALGFKHGYLYSLLYPSYASPSLKKNKRESLKIAF